MIAWAIIFILIQASRSIWVPKILWAYWNKPIQQNSYLNLFVKNHQRYAHGWDIRHINQQTIKQYVKQIPEYDNDLQVFYFNRKAQLADYIRVLLLHHYGGVYIDFTCIFTQNLDWLDEQNLKLNPDILNKYGNQPDYLSFTFPTYGPNKKYYDEQSNYQYEISPGYEVWFFATKAKGEFITEMFKYYRKAYLTTKNVDKHDEKNNYLDVIIKNEKIEVGALDHYLLINQLQQIVLQRKQRELNKDNNSSKLILAVNYFKLWHLKVETGPFGIGIKLYIRQKYFLLKFSLNSIDKFKFKYKYLLKLTGSERNTLTTYLEPIYNKQKGFKQTIAQIKQVSNFDMIDKRFCPQNYWIRQKSAIDTFLLTDDYRKKLLIKNNFSPLETLCLPLKKFLKILITLNKKYQFLGDQTKFLKILQRQIENKYITDEKEIKANLMNNQKKLIQKQDLHLLNYSKQIGQLYQKLQISRKSYSQLLFKFRQTQLSHQKITLYLKNDELYQEIILYSLAILLLGIILTFIYKNWEWARII